MQIFILGGIASAWLVLTPLMWTQTPIHAAMAIIVGAVGLVLSPVSLAWSPARSVMATLGFLLAVAGMTLHAEIGQLANDCAVGVTLLLAGVAPGVKTYPAARREPARIPVLALGSGVDLRSVHG